MFVYLLVGLIVMLGLMWGYIDVFFDRINNSISLLSRRCPDLPKSFIKFIFSIIFILYWLGWPLLVIYTLYKVTQE